MAGHGLIGLKLVEMAGNCWRSLELAGNDWNSLEIAGNSLNAWKWQEMAGMAGMLA